MKQERQRQMKRMKQDNQHKRETSHQSTIDHIQMKTNLVKQGIEEGRQKVINYQSQKRIDA